MRILPCAVVFVNNIFPLRQILFLAIMSRMRLLNTAEVAEKLGVSVRRVRQLISEGKISAHNLGRDYAIEESALTQVKIYGKAGRPSKVQIEKADHDANQKANSRKQGRA
jgi:excisionase family DNA binding protein